MKTILQTFVLAAVFTGSVAPQLVHADEDPSAGGDGLHQYQITMDGRRVCWNFDCGVGWCCFVY